MNLPALSVGQVATVAVFMAIVVVGVAILFFVRKRKTKHLRNQFGSAEYARAVSEEGSRRKAEVALDKRLVEKTPADGRSLIVGDTIARGLSSRGPECRRCSSTLLEAP